jgi:XTP/dITP diphosphohydrolase
MAGKSPRGARFRCTMVLAKGGTALADFCGTVEGSITESPRGAGGFGYDPLFTPEGYEQTFGELGSEVKNRLSHRARALELAVSWLEARAKK